MPNNNSKKVNLGTVIFVGVSLLATATFSSHYRGSGPDVNPDNTQLLLGEMTSLPDSLWFQAEQPPRPAKQEKESIPQPKQEEVQEPKTPAEPKQQNPSPQNKIDTNEKPVKAAGQSDPKTHPVAQTKPKPAAEPELKAEPVSEPVPQPDPEPKKLPQPSSSGLSQAENEMLSLVNDERKSTGLQPLKATGELTAVARAHSGDMVDNNFFSHTSPTHGSLSERLKMFNISYTAAGENIAGAGTVSRAHNNLMNSPGHRANILNGNYTHVGIGIVRCDKYGLMITQIFMRQ